MHPDHESIRNVAEHFAGNFAATPLRLHHAGQRDELIACVRIANGPVPCRRSIRKGK
jgi:hypothetical protein